MRGRGLYFLAVLMVLSLAVFPVTAQEPEPQEEQDQEETEQGRGRGRGGRDQEEQGIKPYDEVITDEAESDDGVFTVHNVDDKFYYENSGCGTRTGVPVGWPNLQDRAPARVTVDGRSIRGS